jgi:hypothetical protein
LLAESQTYLLGVTAANSEAEAFELGCEKQSNINKGEADTNELGLLGFIFVGNVCQKLRPEGIWAWFMATRQENIHMN